MRKKKGQMMAEVTVTMSILFFFCMFPLIDLLGLATSASSLLLLTHQTASSAASQQGFTSALNAITGESRAFANSGFAKFAKITPVGGYKNSGIDLFITVTNFHTNDVTVIGPNTPLPAAADELQNIYEYTCQCNYQVAPLVPMECIPVINEIPGLGKPVNLKFAASRAIEHLAIPNLTSKSSAALPSIASSSGGGTSSAPSSNPSDPAGGNWNNPSIYQQIAAMGQQVVSTDVLIVDATNENWTVSKAYASGGEKIWIDTRADGQWSGTSTSQPFDADGYSPPFVNGMPAGSLEGRLGDTGTPYFSGKSQFNFSPPSGSGFVQFRFNDNPGQYYMNTGSMIVRIIVTQ
ncbi:MAG TPA: hypothetical protein V6C89_16180 [Drouetiella sp.]